MHERRTSLAFWVCLILWVGLAFGPLIGGASDPVKFILGSIGLIPLAGAIRISLQEVKRRRRSAGNL
jgi:hypothetical protein